MLQGVDPTTLTIVSTIAALAIGTFFMRARYRQAHEDFEAKKSVAVAKKQRVTIEHDLAELEKELEGKPIPRELLESSSSEAEDSTSGGLAGKLGKKGRGLTLVPGGAAEGGTKLVTLEDALKGTKSGLFGRIKAIFQDSHSYSSSDLESIEEVLYTSDLGPHTVQKLIGAVTEKLESSEKKDVEAVREALRGEMLHIFESTQGGLKKLDRYFSPEAQPEFKPEVWMVVGVNGAGKTTTIGKLAHKLASSGKTVLIAAGDTFRAAAGEQLKVWSERAQVEIFAPDGVESPSAVAFDAVKVAQQKGFDHVILDTAGRLHTQKNLMEELKKVKRVIEKCQAGSPQEVLLVLDANSGQNALIQAKEFHAAVGVTGVVLTKLDGTAKGGMAVGVAAELGLPIQLIGVGEGKDDLRPFIAADFVNAIL